MGARTGYNQQISFFITAHVSMAFHMFSVCTFFGVALSFHRARLVELMDRAAIAQLSLYQLRTLIFLALQEFGRRLGVETNEDTVFRVSAGTVAPGDLISETAFPAPGTPPLPTYLCVHRCSRCWRYCFDQNPAHVEHLCAEHAVPGQSDHRNW